MKRLAVLMLVGLGAAACGGDNKSPSSPTASDPNIIVFTAALRASNEVPPVTNADSGATGTSTMTFNLVRSGSTISSGTVTMQFNVSGFPNGTNATLAHIHTGNAAVAGPVLVNTGLSAATAVSMPAGTGSFSSAAIAVDAATIQQIIDNPGNFYFNVHTVLNPGGAVRGQLTRQ